MTACKRGGGKVARRGASSPPRPQSSWRLNERTDRHCWVRPSHHSTLQRAQCSLADTPTPLATHSPLSLADREPGCVHVVPMPQTAARRATSRWPTADASTALHGPAAACRHCPTMADAAAAPPPAADPAQAQQQPAAEPGSAGDAPAASGAAAGTAAAAEAAAGSKRELEEEQGETIALKIAFGKQVGLSGLGTSTLQPCLWQA